MTGDPARPEQPGTEIVMEEQASGFTDLPMRIDVDKRTTEVTESDRQTKRSKTDVSLLVNEQQLVPDFVTGAKIGKRWESHGGGQWIQSIMMNAIQSTLMNPKRNVGKVTTQNKQCSGLMRSSPKEPIHESSAPLGFASWLCIGLDR